LFGRGYSLEEFDPTDRSLGRGSILDEYPIFNTQYSIFSRTPDRRNSRDLDFALDGIAGGEGGGEAGELVGHGRIMNIES
jgi:hypothetical protein